MKCAMRLLKMETESSAIVRFRPTSKFAVRVGGRSSVEVDRADSVTQRHQAHAKELTQHTGAVIAFAKQHCQCSVHVDVGGAGCLSRQDLAKSNRRTSGKQVRSNRVVEGRDLVGSREPVLVGEREVQVGRNQGSVCGSRSQRGIPHAHRLGVHTSDDIGEEDAEVLIVAHQLEPLRNDLRGLGLRVEGVVLGVEAVAGNASGRAPRGILEHGDIVGANGDCVGLAEADLNDICEAINSLGIDGSDDRGHDLLIDALQDAIERRVAIETLTVALEVLKVNGGSFAGLCAADLGCIHQVLALELLVQFLVALRSQHVLNTSGAQAIGRHDSRLAVGCVLIEEDSALRHDIGALIVGRIDHKNRRRNAVQIDFRHVNSLLPYA